MKKKKKIKPKFGSLQMLTLTVSTSMVLVLLGLVVMSVFTAHNLSEYMKENFTVTLLLSDDMDNHKAQAFCKQLQNRPYVNKITFISKEQALKENTVELGVDPSEFAEENPFPSSVELQLKADYANSASLKRIGKELTANKKVSEVSYPKDLMDQVNKTLRQINIVLLALAALLTFISFALINNTVRLTIFARRFIIHTMKLVGASWAFIRWPFIKMALVGGLVSALVAEGVLAGLVYALAIHEEGLFEILTIEVLAITGAAVLLFGLFITTFCCYLSVNKYLRMKAGDLYKI